MPLIKHRPRRFLLIWLNGDLTFAQNPNYEEEVNKLDQQLMKTNRIQACYNIIRDEIEYEASSPTIFIAWEPSMPESIVDFAQIPLVSALFIFSSKPDANDYKNCPKFRGIFTNFSELFDALKRFVSITTDETHLMTSSTSLNSSEHNSNTMVSSMCTTYPLIASPSEETLCASDSYRVKVFVGNRFTARKYKEVESFLNQSDDENKRNIIQWFSSNLELSYYSHHVWHNEFLRDLEYLYVFFRLINEHLKRENLQKSTNLSDELRLYRGECVNRNYIEHLTTNRNNFISFKGLWSASLYENVAKRTFENRIFDLCNVLFIVQIDRKLSHRSMFADVSHLTSNPDEGDVLFSIGSIFRIESIEFNEKDSFYTVVLMLIDDNRLVIDMLITSANPTEISERFIYVSRFFFSTDVPELAVECLLKIDPNLIEGKYFDSEIFHDLIEICYLNLNEADQTEQLIRKCFQIIHQDRNFEETITILYQLTNLFEQNRYHIAERIIAEAIALSDGNSQALAKSMEISGSIYEKQLKLVEAEKKYYSAFRLIKEYYETWQISHLAIGHSAKKMGEFYEKHGRLHAALGFYRYAEEIYNQNPIFSHLISDIPLQIQRVESRLRS